MSFSGVVADFNRRLELHDPVGIVLAIGKDATKLFALQRVRATGDTPITRWQFQNDYPQFSPYVTIKNGQLQLGQRPTGVVQVLGRGQPFGGGNPLVVKPLASFLRAFQLDGGYTPGPLFLLSVVAGLLGSLAVARRRATPAQPATATACLLVFTAGAAGLLRSGPVPDSWAQPPPALGTLPPPGGPWPPVLSRSFAAPPRQPPAAAV